MKTHYTFAEKCPTVNDYETYLKGTGTVQFNEAFKLHLTTCELCNTSIQGYQTSGIKTPSDLLHSNSNVFRLKTKNSTHFQLKILSYAASLALLIGLSAIYISQQNKRLTFQEAANYDYSLFIENQPDKNKKLTKKTTSHFIYINNCNKIAFDDQFLSADELAVKLKNQKNISLITIEVASNNYECSTRLINAIKSHNNAPTITISSSREIKKLTSRGGAVGG